jgi:nucleotide-binding universal stress UspA family protein
VTEPRSDSEELLVAIDFSPCSLRALDTALARRGDNGEVTLLHVLDHGLIRQVEALGLATAEAMLERMRSRAEERLGALAAERGHERIETMVVVGEPFMEIVKIANDLDCDFIFVGIHGRETGVAQLLFGGTAEKVVRGANRPVVCVP